MSRDEDNVLNFEMAMSQFSSMFPDLNKHLIESVLRKYGGNVAQTIDELLKLSAEENSSPSSSSRILQNMREETNERKKEDIINDKEHVTESGLVRDLCADDEKIALLIQNREFLRYLRHSNLKQWRADTNG